MGLTDDRLEDTDDGLDDLLLLPLLDTAPEVLRLLLQGELMVAHVVLRG